MEVLGKKSSSSDDNIRKIIKLPSIDDFTLTKPISRGAFGKVFLGIKNDKPDQMYAIKVMKKSEMVNKNMINQVLTERDALAVSRSPFIVQLFYSMQSKNNIFLVMEYMIGGDLKSLLHVYGLFDESMAIFYIAEAVQALEYLHHHNIVHRDLKPDNMLISADGHMKLTDFGLSKITIKKTIQLKDLIGTPSCLSTSSKYLKTRTPGQLLSLTSSLMFTAPTHSSPRVCETASPILSKTRSRSGISDIKLTSPMPDNSVGLQHRTTQERIASSGSMTSKLLQFDSPPLSTENAVRKLRHSNDHVFTPGIRQCRSYVSSSRNSTSPTSATPYHPKQKRKILQSRSTKNLREMKSSSPNSSFCADNNTRPKRRIKAPKLKNAYKRIRSTSSSDDVKLSFSSKTADNTSGLTAVISDIRFDESSKCKKKLPKNPTEVCLSFPSDTETENSVFFSASSFNDSLSEMGPPHHRPKLIKKKILQPHHFDEESDSKCLHSSLLDDSEKVTKSKRNVNFCLKPPNPSRFSDSFNSHSPIPPLFPVSAQKSSYFKDSDSVLLNSLVHTPSLSERRNARAHSTPVSIINTPYRTPKSVRRGPELDSDRRILGTPDYLAPEFLLHQEHGFPVDWWALGVCLFEFLTGIPPFNDVTPDAVFSNILHRDIPWPVDEEALSENAQEAIDKLLTFDASERPGAKELKTWPLFSGLEWENLLQIKAPFIPIPDSPSDTTYFEARNSIQHLEVSNVDM